MANGLTQNWDEKRKEECRKEFVFDIAKNMNDNDSLILAYLYNLYKEYQQLERVVLKNTAGKEFDTAFLVAQSFISVNGLASAVFLSGRKVRTSILKLETGNFIKKKKEDHSWLYSITSDGVSSLNYLCDKHLFPERVKMINKILNR